MSSFWWIFVVLIVITQNQQAQRRRQMGPRLRVSNSEFLNIVKEEMGLVIMGPKVIFTGNTYLTRSGDSRHLVRSPSGAELERICPHR